jgi:hypothetical protein
MLHNFLARGPRKAKIMAGCGAAGAALSGRYQKPPCLQARARRHRVQAQGLALPLRPLADWLKMKNPEAPAVKREAEEDWGRDRWR